MPMSWILALRNFTNDHVRQLQFFMVCRQLGIILSSVVLAWFLPVSSVGVVEMLMFTGYLMTFFWSDALLRGYLAHPKLKDDSQSATSFFLLFFLMSVLAMLLLVAGRQFLVPLFTGRNDLEGLGLFVMYQILIVPLWMAPFIGILKGQNILLASLFILIGPAFAVWTGYTSIPQIQGVLLGLFCYALVGFVWVLTKTKLIRDIRLGKIVEMVWPAAWPLMLYAVSNGLARSFDAWLVAREFDESTFAVFRYGAREFPLVVAISTALTTAMIPRLFSDQALGELRARSIRVMHSSYPIIALLILSSPLLFKLVFGLAYVQSAGIFNIYLLLTLTQLVFPQSILIARGQTKLLWWVSIAELAINVIASLLLMPNFGLAGIAFGTLIAFTFEKVVLFYFIDKKFGIKVQQIIDLRIWIFYTLLLVASFILSQWLHGI